MLLVSRGNTSRKVWRGHLKGRKIKVLIGFLEEQ